jgi:hypothetical protein
MLSARAVRDGRCGAAAQALELLSENRVGAAGRKSAARILMDARETPASPRRISFLQGNQRSRAVDAASAR